MQQTLFFTGVHWESIGDSIGIPLGFHWASIVRGYTPCHLRSLDTACRALLCNVHNWSVEDWLQAWSTQRFGMFSDHGLLGDIPNNAKDIVKHIKSPNHGQYLTLDFTCVPSSSPPLSMLMWHAFVMSGGTSLKHVLGANIDVGGGRGGVQKDVPSQLHIPELLSDREVAVLVGIV